MQSNQLSKKTNKIISDACGVQAALLISTINTWLRCSGTEWTVTRLKAYWAAALQLRAGNHSVVKSIYQKHSIQYRRKDLIPKGPFGPIVWKFTHAQRPSILRRMALVLRIYTSMSLPKLSKSQYNKARNAINNPYPGSDDELAKLAGLVVQGVRRLNLQPIKVGSPDIRGLKPFTGVHVPSFGRYGQWFSLPIEMRSIAYGRLITSMTTNVWLPQSLRHDKRGETYRQFLEQSGATNTHSGHIMFLQEQGAKARVVAVPNGWLQWSFAPLAESLDRTCRSIPTSACHDQNKGADFMVSSMSSGKKLWCFDLSSATDRFPLLPQLALLKELKLSRYASALRDVASQPWEVDTELGDYEEWNYSCGQPQGLYGSFPSFHLTHICVLEGCLSLLESNGHTLPPSQQLYCVLGDDVVINYAPLADLYSRTMTDLAHVELSDQKSIESFDVGEFAGFLCLKTNKGPITFRPYKHSKDPKKINNSLNLIANMGHSFSHPYWKKKAITFSKTLPWRNADLSPLFETKNEPDGTPGSRIDVNRLCNLIGMSYQAQLDPENGSRFLLGPMLYDMQWDFACRLMGYQPEQVDSSQKRTPDQLLETTKQEIEEERRNIELVLSRDPLMKDFANSETPGYVSLLRESRAFVSKMSSIQETD